MGPKSLLLVMLVAKGDSLSMFTNYEGKRVVHAPFAMTDMRKYVRPISNVNQVLRWTRS